MYFVYILKELNKEHFYTGSTNNLERRLTEHEEGICRSTVGRNWKLFCYFAFKNETVARDFEKYLKTGSGRSFAKKTFFRKKCLKRHFFCFNSQTTLNCFT